MKERRAGRETGWRRVLAAGLVLLFVLPASAAKAYRCDGPDGVRFQDRPCAGAYRSEAPPATILEPPPRPDTGPVAAATGESRAFFWSAEKASGARFHLLGSIHFGLPDFYPLPDPVVAAFDGADALVVELDILAADPLVTARTFARNGLYDDGTTLEEQLPAETWRRLVRLTAPLGLAEPMLQPQRPWLVAMTLGSLSIKQAGLSEQLGIDLHFLQRARRQGKPVIELEGLERQATLLASLSPRAQIAMLEDSLRILEQGPDYYQRMVEIWRRGDPQALERLMRESLSGGEGSAELDRAIIIERNHAMMEKLRELADKGGDYFVVVGAAHLVGPSGLVNLLRRAGYRLQRP